MLSGEIHDMFSPDIQHICREIDTVTLKGSLLPMRLFTVDIWSNDLEPEVDKLQAHGLQYKKKKRDEQKQKI